MASSATTFDDNPSRSTNILSSVNRALVMRKMFQYHQLTTRLSLHGICTFQGSLDMLFTSVAVFSESPALAFSES